MPGFAYGSLVVLFRGIPGGGWQVALGHRAVPALRPRPSTAKCVLCASNSSLAPSEVRNTGVVGNEFGESGFHRDLPLYRRQIAGAPYLLADLIQFVYIMHDLPLIQQWLLTLRFEFVSCLSSLCQW